MQRPAASTLIGVNLDQASGSGTRLSGRWLLFARMLWVAIFVLTLTIFIVSLVVNKFDLLLTILLVVATSVWFVVSSVLFWRKSHDRVILLFSMALMLLGGIFVAPFPIGVPQLSLAWELLLDAMEFLAQAAFLVFFLFPDGRFVPRWTRRLALGWIALSLDGNLPRFLSAFNAWSSPFSLSIYKLVEVAFFGSLVYSQLFRYRCVSSPIQRQQTKWVIFVFAIVLIGASAVVLELNVVSYYFPALALPDQLAQLVSSLAIWLFPALVPLSIGIALLRYHLWDIDLIINRTLVYGFLTVCIVAFYILVVVGLGMILQAQGNPGIALLATGLVAVLFQPLRTRLQRVVNRFMYGERDDPYRVISWLGQRLEATLAPDVVLPTIVETVALALKLPYAAITLKQGDAFKTAATSGTPQAGVAAHAVRLAEDLKQLTIDLQRSRERLVTAREEERRRLRRDLHDGLGPQLAGLTLKLETARNRLAHDVLADTLLSDLTNRTQAAVGDIRRLVYALRPPALDELGLLPALREQALQYNEQGDNGLSISIDAPEHLPELSAAVEVAVYRITQEALTNVVRHAHARKCMIFLALDEKAGLLTLEVRDDGAGMPPTHKKGVGLTSMRERAEELGGTWSPQQIPAGGTRILVHLPYLVSTSAGSIDQQPLSLLQEEDN